MQKDAGKIIHQWRRNKDLKVFEAENNVYAAKLEEWGEARACGAKGMGQKPKKPTKPKVRKGPPTEDEIEMAAAIAHLSLVVNGDSVSAGRRGAGAVAMQEICPESNNDNKGNSEEAIDLSDSKSEVSKYEDSE